MQYPSWRENNRHDQTYQAIQGAGASERRLQVQRPASDALTSHATTTQVAVGNTYQEELEQTQLFIPTYQPLANGRSNGSPTANPYDVNEEKANGDRLNGDGLNGEEDTSLAAAFDTVRFDPHSVWQTLLSELALQMPSASYNTWVRDTWVLGYEDGEFIIGIPNAYARDWLENRLRNKIKRALGSLVHRSVQVSFRVCPRQVTDAPNAKPAPLYAMLDTTTADTTMVDSMVAEEPVVRKEKIAPAPRAAVSTEKGLYEPVARELIARETFHGGSRLNAAHTFETFVVGNHNKLAHAAAEAVAEKPGQSFNPLFIYGGVGLGKTHLLHAIGNRAQQLGYKMLYCSSEQFTNDLIASIRGQSTEQFRNKYREVDILLIDDIQFIGGKESTQEEFFHTFNHLHASGRQVILSSDRPPKALATLEERLRSRFEGGLQTDISQPDYETRVAILQSKANRMGVPVDPGVLLMVAERVDSNIRELEGALNRLIMQARLANTSLSVGLAASILNNLAPQRTPCTPVTVIRVVAEHFRLHPDDLTGRRRTKDIAAARQIAMYLLREENGLSLPAIGEQLGGRDHSTVRYGVEQVNIELERDEALRREIVTLRDKIYTPFIG